MSNTSQVTDFQDLYTDLLNRTRQNTSVANLKIIAKRYINQAVQHIVGIDEFEWGKRWSTFVTNPDYTTGTVAISQGSTALTGTDTTWNTANALSVNNARITGKLKLGSEVYEISSVDSDTGITLASSYTQSDLSGDSYSYFEDEYALASDFDKPVWSQNLLGDLDIPIVSTGDFYRNFIRNSITGQPRLATIIDRTFGSSTTRVQRMVFHPSPADFYTIKYRYVTSNIAVDSTGAEASALSADDDEPIIPLKYRNAIVQYALSQWWRDRNDDTRSQEARADYDATIAQMKSDTGAATPRPRIRIQAPRIRYWGYSRGRTGRRYQTGTEFDELRV